MDLELSVEQREIVELFTTVVARAGGAANVREHEELGVDPALWEQMVAIGAPGMGVPADAGGGDSALLDLALATEALGAQLAPVPFVEHSVSARLLVRAGAPDALVGEVVEGTVTATVALRPADGAGRASLVPAGAVAGCVVALDGDELVAVVTDPPMTAVPNLASAPLADRAVGTGTGAGTRHVLAQGPDAVAAHEQAADEWRALTAAALVGVGVGALAIGTAYVTEREQFGVPIGSFQSIQHALADVSVVLDGAQLLARKAAWALDEQRDDASTLAASALLFAAEQAQRATERVLHFHGGYGFMQEYDIQLFYRRAKGWPLVLDAPGREYARLAARRYGPLRAPTLAG